MLSEYDDRMQSSSPYPREGQKAPVGPQNLDGFGPRSGVAQAVRGGDDGGDTTLEMGRLELVTVHHPPEANVIDVHARQVRERLGWGQQAARGPLAHALGLLEGYGLVQSEPAARHPPEGRDVPSTTQSGPQISGK